MNRSELLFIGGMTAVALFLSLLAAYLDGAF